MSAYRYRAARADGRIVRGVVEAASAGQADVVLTDRGLAPVEVTLLATRSELRRAARRRDLALVFQSLAALVGAGVPLERAVAATESLARGPLRDLLRQAQVALREGQPLSGVLATVRGLVPGVVIGMIRAGEAGSALPAALDHAARHLDQEAALAGRVQQALAYPVLLAIAGTGSVLVIGTIIVPRFAELLRDAGAPVPLATRLLLAGSTSLSRYWVSLVAIGVLGFWGLARWLGQPAGRHAADAALLALPVVGPVRHALATARVARALGAMLAAGVPLLAALDAACDAAGDSSVARRLGVVRERVAAGESVTTALIAEGALVRGAVQLVAVGETSGRLADLTLRAGALAAQDAERGLAVLVAVIEPALIVGFGVLVAFVAAALLQAVYSLRPAGL